MSGRFEPEEADGPDGLRELGLWEIWGSFCRMVDREIGEPGLLGLGRDGLGLSD